MKKVLKCISLLAATTVSGLCFGQMASPAKADTVSERPFTEEKCEFTASNGQSISYYLVKPLDFNEESNYPLVVYLHGVGGDTDISGYESLRKQLFSRGFNCVFLAPLANWSGGQTWIDYEKVLAVPEVHGSYDQSAQPITPALLAAKELIEQTKSTCHTDPARSYVLGVSMGSYGTWDLITRYPDLMTAAVPICGAGDPTMAWAIKDLPLWAFHGTADQAVSVEGSREMIAALKDAGSGVARYTEYEGIDHGIWFKVFEDKDMLPWLFSQGTGITDSFKDLSLTSEATEVSINPSVVLGGKTYSCLVRGSGEGCITYTASDDNTIADAQLKLALMYEDVQYYMNEKGYSSINDLIRLEYRTGTDTNWASATLSASKPVSMGKLDGSAYTFSSMHLAPESPLPANVTAVRFVFSSGYVNWYMLADSASILYAPKESQVTWVDPEPEIIDTWDGHMTEGWDGVDDFTDLSHTVDSNNIQTIQDPYVQQTVAVKSGHTPEGYIRYAQKDCYISDITLQASLIEGFLPANVDDWLSVCVRTADSDRDIPVPMTKSQGTLLYENSNAAYNYYSSVITPAAALPERVISVKITLATQYINYTMYLDKAVLTFTPIPGEDTSTTTSTTSTLQETEAPSQALSANNTAVASQNQSGNNPDTGKFNNLVLPAIYAFLMLALGAGSVLLQRFRGC